MVRQVKLFRLMWLLGGMIRLSVVMKLARNGRKRKVGSGKDCLLLFVDYWTGKCRAVAVMEIRC